jgi:esterase/lipase superfamily enzyme
MAFAKTVLEPRKAPIVAQFLYQPGAAQPDPADPAANPGVSPKLAQALKEIPELKIRIESSGTGGGDPNSLALAERRAKNLREFLKSNGVRDDQVTVRNYGKLPYEDIPRQSNAVAITLESGPPFAIIRIPYVTDRTRINQDRCAEYSYDDQSPVEYGIALVSVPGQFLTTDPWETDWLLDVNHNRNEAKEVTALCRLPVSRERFLEQVKEAASDKALLYIHGYNSAFDDAIRGAAVLAADLGYRGVAANGSPQAKVIAYSWSSADSAPDYLHDTERVTNTSDRLLAFLTDLRTEMAAADLSVIAHSMGNRAIVKALKSWGNGPGGSPFRNVLLVAPDVNLQGFRDDYTEFRKHADRVTLYASSADKALLLSQKANGDPRVGQGGATIFVRSDMDSIEASEVCVDWLGHGYQLNNAFVKRDLAQTLQGKTPAQRECLNEVKRGGDIYWVLTACP